MRSVGVGQTEPSAIGETAVSAHRCNDRRSLVRASLLGCEFVEFDVQRTADGELVLHHDDTVADGRRRVRVSRITRARLSALRGDEVVGLDEALRIVSGRARAHVDLKFRTWDGAAEVAAAALAVQIMGDDRAIITTRSPASVRAVRAWSRRHAPGLLVGLSVWPHEVSRQSLLRKCDANFVAAHHWAARLHAARMARRLGLPLMVWTVDRPRSLSRWVASTDARLVTINRADRALALRRVVSCVGSSLPKGVVRVDAPQGGGALACWAHVE